VHAPLNATLGTERMTIDIAWISELVGDLYIITVYVV
jgi:hypothetical protein